MMDKTDICMCCIGFIVVVHATLNEQTTLYTCGLATRQQFYPVPLSLRDCLLYLIMNGIASAYNDFSFLGTKTCKPIKYRSQR